MSDFHRPLRQPWKPAEGTREAMVMKFMAEHGHPGYQNEIDGITEDYTLIQAEAGPAHGFCPFTQERLDAIDRQVQEIVRDAVDRYEDWVTDAYA